IAIPEQDARSAALPDTPLEKSEIRISKSETNLNYRNPKDQNRGATISDLLFWPFGFVSDFGFWHSDFPAGGLGLRIFCNRRRRALQCSPNAREAAGLEAPEVVRGGPSDVRGRFSQ